MTPQDPLSELRDIHLPDPGGFWPPAPGWWALMALLLILFVAALWLIRQRRKNTRWLRQASSELSELEKNRTHDAAWFARLNALLKRAARHRYPDLHPEALSGEAWISFLLEKAPSDRIASRPVVEGMVYSAWHPDINGDARQAIEFSRRWLRGQS